MTPERWRRIKEITFAAMDLEPNERAGFVNAQSGGDEELRERVERLLAADAKSDDTFEQAIAAVAANVDDPSDPGGPDDRIGRQISHYRITEKIGEGGMGVVYKAKDTNLNRPVALKFLAAHSLGQQEIKARFVREAEASAVLNHPNVCHIYEIAEAEGETFIAMALIEGDPLDKRIEPGPLKLDEALDIAIQAAQGLQAAHDKKIVHRDIKPANLMVARSGSRQHVTVMDFGLARLSDRSKLSRANQIMGTVSYMSPEQTHGTDVDQRTDIWSLGVVIYEMVTGRQPFRGHYDKAVTYSITDEEPEPMTALRTGVPMDLEWIVNKCLAKDPAHRYQSTAELVVDLETLSKRLESGEPAVLSARSPLARAKRRQRMQRWGGLAMAALAVMLLGLSIWLWRSGSSSDAPAPVNRFSLDPDGVVGGSISPDGRQIAYVTRDATGISMWLYSLDRGTHRELERMEEAIGGFLSSDSQSLAFATRKELKRVSLEGGEPITLCSLPGTEPFPFMYGSWSPDGERIAFASGRELYEVSARGGEPQLLLEQDMAEGSESPFFGYPTYLPTTAGTRGLVYAVGSSTIEHRLVVLDLETGERRDLGPGSVPKYSPSGHLVYQTGWTETGLWALPFSLETLTAIGEPFRIVEEGRAPTVARDGTLVYNLGATRSPRQLVWRDRGGNQIGTIGEPQAEMSYPALSPDEKRVAVDGRDGGNRDIWIHEVDRPVKTRVTFHEETDLLPTWSPAGDRVVFSSGRSGNRDVYVTSADGSGEPVRLVGSANEREYVSDWSADGKVLMFTRQKPGPTNVMELWFLRKKEDGSGYDQAPFLQSDFVAGRARLSADGRLVAYGSNHSGRHEVYIRSFPDGRDQRRVSANGGEFPRWRKDGQELFYVEGTTLMVVPISVGPSLTIGRPVPLSSSASLAWTVAPERKYDVTSDGQRFVLVEPLAPDTKAEIHVIQNWYEEFRDREQD